MTRPPLPTARATGEADPPEITIDDPASFAWGVFHRRHPVLVERVGSAHPYGPDQHEALTGLLAESTAADQPMQPLPDRAPDSAAWRRWGARHLGGPWSAAPFLWAESYFYRRLLDAVGYFEPGPWYRLDPFEPTKTEELRSEGTSGFLAQLDQVSTLSGRDRTRALLLAALWGNRADLSFAMGGTGSPTAEDELLVDDLDPVLEHLYGRAGTVHLVADNAGRELLADLALLEQLLTTGAAERVVLHVKPVPYYVSDATTADVSACLRRLSGAAEAPAEIADRLWAAFAAGRVRIATHPFWCAPLPLRQAPPDLLDELAGSVLTIVKGDLNYRRLVGDRSWPPTTEFSAVTDFLPTAVLALRTLKSDVVVGLAEGVAPALDAAGPAWRTSGAHGLAQWRPAPAEPS